MDYSAETRKALTHTMRDNMKAAVGSRCEHCGKWYDNNVLHVHHISEVSRANGGFDLNAPSNLIVLCANCHGNAHNGRITPQVLHDIVYNRKTELRRRIEGILEDRKVVTQETTRQENDKEPLLIETVARILWRITVWLFRRVTS